MLVKNGGPFLVKIDSGPICWAGCPDFSFD